MTREQRDDLLEKLRQLHDELLSRYRTANANTLRYAAHEIDRTKEYDDLLAIVIRFVNWTESNDVDETTVLLDDARQLLDRIEKSKEGEGIRKLPY